ncbi:transmembrane protein, putative [Bodo saltans]|uniref:Transmembrane protein, putative n=1 Tax=Bodo saltans TaxID=75058 RepID=A0A0S4IKZ5_BODSA|nr:transmembrane protein, putative [Bodo saltans]|eukprot:CUF16782.1 transmembrane protein, putative [Bodo saltans]
MAMFTVQNSIIQNISINIVDSSITIYQRVPDLSSRIVSIEPAASSFLSSLVDNLSFTMTRSTSNIIGFASNAFVFLLFANAPTATSSWTFSNIKVLIDASSVWIVTQELNAGCAVVSYSSYASVRSSLRGNVHCNVSNSAFYLTASTGSVLVSVDKIIAVSGLDVDVRNTTVEGKILSTDDDAASTAAVVSVIAQRSLEFATIRLHTVTATFVVQCGEPPQLTSSYELAVLVATSAVTISNTLVSVELSSMFAQRSSTPPKHSTSSSTSPPLLYLFQFSDSHIVSLRKAANASNVSVVLRDVSMFASLNLTMVPIASAFVRLVVMDASLVLNAITLLENSTVIISRSTLVAEVAVTTPSPGSAITNFLGVSCIALIALGDPATIGSARLAAEMPQFVDAFPSSYTATAATLVGCNVAVDNNSFHISAALTQEVYVGIVLLPGAIVGTKLIIENVTLTSPLTTSSSSSNPLSAPWRTSALLCAITCSVNDSSYVRLMSVGTRDSTTTTAISMLTGPLVQIISGDVNPLTVRMIIDRSNITLKGLMASTNIATATSMSGGYTSSPSVVNSSQRVIVRGWSVVDIDGCTFYQYSGSLFGSNVIWDVNATSSATTTASSLPRIHLGCNAASLGQPTSTSTSLVPINLKLLGGGVPVGIVDYPDDDFTSPYLPQVVCQRATPEEVVTTASPYLVRGALSKRSSAVTTTTSVLIAALIVVQGLLPISASGGIHSLQSTLLARRKQQWCLQTSAANTSIVSDDNVTISDGVDDDSNMCCDIGTSPTQLSFGSNSVSGALLLSLLLGAVVANSVLVVGLCLLRLLLVAAGRQSAYLATSSSLRGFCHPVGPVAALWMPFTLLMSPTISCVVAIMILPDTSVGIAVFGAFCLCAWSLPWAGSIYGLCWRRRKPYPFRGCVPKGRLQRSFKQRLLEPRELLDAPMAARPYARQLLHADGPVIEGYIARCYWYFNVETMFAFMNGIVMWPGVQRRGAKPVLRVDRLDVVRTWCS